MNSLKLFSCQIVLLVSLYRGYQSQQIRMRIYELEIWDDNDPRSVIYAQEVLIKVSEDRDEYFFESDDLTRICGQRFTSQNVEIIRINSRALSFSLITADRNLTLDCVFVTDRDLQLFFSQLRKTLVLEASTCANVSRTVLRLGDGRMLQIANDGLLYRKRIDRPQEVHATYSYNLIRLYSRSNQQTGETIQTQEVDVVFISRKFNVTGLIENNKVGICLPFLVNGDLLLLRFADFENASLFLSLVETDTEPTIKCSIGNNWMARYMHFIDQPEEFYLPRLPYLR